jgi:hypothetical protein
LLHDRHVLANLATAAERNNLNCLHERQFSSEGYNRTCPP